MNNNETTFFFSNFPNNFGEYDMWKIFQRWGRLKEVFISRRLDRKGRRFGFVRFWNVKHQGQLESELDAIRIGNIKMQVNIARFSKEKEKSTPAPKEKPKVATVWKRKDDHQTYAQAVKSPIKKHYQRNEITTTENEIEWLNRCVVGRVNNYDLIESIQEHFIMGGMGSLSAKYMGDNMMLISGGEGIEVTKVVEENKSWFETMFDSIVPWSNREIAGNKVIWVRCRGLPLSCWNEECLTKVMATFGTLIKVVQIVNSKKDFEHIRVKVRVPIAVDMRLLWKDIKINGHVYHITLEEEFLKEEKFECSCEKRGCTSSENSFAKYPQICLSSQSECSELLESEVQWPDHQIVEQTVESPEEHANGEERDVGADTGHQVYNMSNVGKSFTKKESFHHDQKHIAQGTESITKVESSVKTISDGKMSDLGEKADPRFVGVVMSPQCWPTNMSLVQETQLGPNQELKVQTLSTHRSPTSPITNTILSNKNSNLKIGHQKEGREECNEVNISRGDDRATHMVYDSEKTGQHSQQQEREANATTNEKRKKKEPQTNSNAMTLINQAAMDPKTFAERKSFWVGESSRRAEQRTVTDNNEATNAEQRRKIRSAIHTISNSISDSEINNCNRLFWLKNGSLEVIRLWELGKQIGVTLNGKEEDIMLKLEELEKRDKELKKERDRGDTNLNQ